MNETDLAKPVINWLTEQHWDVYQEVQLGTGGVADIMAVRSGMLWVIECKTSFTLTVLDQARHWKAHYRSVCVPRKKGYFTGLRDQGIENDLAKYFQIGILEVNGYDDRKIHESVSAPLMREYHKSAKKIIQNLKPQHKTFGTAGQNNGHYWTPYKETMSNIESILTKFPGIDLKTIVEKLEDRHHYSKSSVIPCIRQALENWEKDWCEIQKDEKGRNIYFVKKNEMHLK